ncbi:putative reverse transcriptase domain-containing protein [Tanacetum coccineum]
MLPFRLTTDFGGVKDGTRAKVTGELRIMPPRRFKEKSIRKIVERRVAKAIEKYEKTRADSNNTGDLVQRILKERLQVKFAMCTFEGRALTWWNGNVQTLGLANANQIPWSNVKAMMTTEYCPATEIQRMEQELWTLTLKGDDIEAYSKRPSYELVFDVQGQITTPGSCHPRCGKCHKLVTTRTKDCLTRIPVSGRKFATGCDMLWRAYVVVKGNEASGMVHALVGGETNQNLNNMEDNI